MSFKEWLEEMKEEWQFQKRHPQMFILFWITIAWAIYLLLKEAKL